MHQNDFVWKHGRVVHWNLDSISAMKSCQEQLDDLTEDLAQVAFGDSLLLDVGYYRYRNVAGSFLVRLFPSNEWETVIWEYECATCVELRAAIEQGIIVANDIYQQSVK